MNPQERLDQSEAFSAAWERQEVELASLRRRLEEIAARDQLLEESFASIAAIARIRARTSMQQEPTRYQELERLQKKISSLTAAYAEIWKLRYQSACKREDRANADHGQVQESSGQIDSDMARLQRSMEAVLRSQKVSLSRYPLDNPTAPATTEEDDPSVEGVDAGLPHADTTE